MRTLSWGRGHYEIQKGPRGVKTGQHPLYKAIYDKYRGRGVLPSQAAALEREMVGLGVSDKVNRARQTFERSAEQAGTSSMAGTALSCLQSAATAQRVPMKSAIRNRRIPAAVVAAAMPPMSILLFGASWRGYPKAARYGPKRNAISGLSF